MTIVLFAGASLRELVRRRLVAAVAILTLAIVAFTAWGLHRLATTTIDGAPIAEPGVHAAAAGIVLLLAFLFSFVIALGAALAAAPAIANEIANGEILSLLARPIRRAEIVLGRWLGVLVALALYVAAAGGIELLVVRLATGYVPPHPVAALAYLSGLAAVVTTAAVALASRLPAIAAGIVAAMMFGLAWIAGIIESVGLALGNERLADAATIVALIYPSDALWRGALFALQPAAFTAATATASATSVNPFSVTAPPPAAMLAWAAGWVVAGLTAGIISFRTRDL